MSTTKPRITITLNDKTAFQLRRLSELTGSSQSSTVSEILDQASPVFERLILVLEAADVAKSSLGRSSIERLKNAQDMIEGQLGLVLGEIGGSASGQKRQACADAGGQKPTPLSNRGVRSTPDVKKITKKRPSNA